MNQDIASPSIEKTDMTRIGNDGFVRRCERCYAPLGNGSTSLKEIAVNVACVVLLALLLVPIISVSSNWLEEHLHHLFRNPVWYEPFDDI